MISKARESNIKAKPRAGFSQKWQGIVQVVFTPLYLNAG